MEKKPANYVNRSKAIGSKQPNVLKSAKASPCENSYRSPEYLYRCKIVCIDDPSVMMAMVLPNEICVLCINSNAVLSRSGKTPEEDMSVLADSHTFRFVDSVAVDSAVSGKKKRGAHELRAGDVVAELCCGDGNTIQLKCPIGGAVLELNQALCRPGGLARLWDKPAGEGYVCVLYPNSEVPSLEYPDWDSLIAKIERSRAQRNICFAWQKGECSRGGNCKFLHSNPNSEKPAADAQTQKKTRQS
jgi:hypothetical protein